jgi:hypothetical protein
MCYTVLNLHELKCFLPSKFAQALKLVTCVSEMPTSDLDWDTDYLDSGFSRFSFFIPGKIPG